MRDASRRFMRESQKKKSLKNSELLPINKTLCPQVGLTFAPF